MSRIFLCQLRINCILLTHVVFVQAGAPSEEVQELGGHVPRGAGAGQRGRRARPVRGARPHAPARHAHARPALRQAREARPGDEKLQLIILNEDI